MTMTCCSVYIMNNCLVRFPDHLLSVSTNDVSSCLYCVIHHVITLTFALHCYVIHSTDRCVGSLLCLALSSLQPPHYWQSGILKLLCCKELVFKEFQNSSEIKC